MYVRLTKGLDDKGTLIPANENIEKYIKDDNKDYYLSVYQYNEDQYKKFQQTKSVGGIKDVITNKLVFDFDSENLVKAKQDTKELVDRLLNKGISKDSINIYFSGKKGFHVEILTNQKFKPDQLKQISKKLSEGLSTWDSVVYNANRILRVEGTKHPATNLFKIPITIEQLNGPIEDIKKDAKAPYEFTLQKITSVPQNILSLANHKKEKVVESTIVSELDLSQKPKFLSPWKYALSQGFFPPGQRSNSLDILARTYKSLGFDETTTYYVLKAAVDHQHNRYPENDKFDKDEIWNNIISQVFAKHNQGGTWAEENFPEQLKKYLIEMGVPRREDQHAEQAVTPLSSALKLFDNYAKSIDENTLKFGIKELDDILKVQLGQLHAILAPPGVGKTSAALTLLNNTSKDGVKSFFASYDMYSSILFQKLIMREMGCTDEDIFNAYRNNDTEKIKNFHKVLEKNYANVSFCFKSGQSIEELKAAIEYEERQSGEKIKLVVVDYLELIRTKSSDPTQSTMEAIQGLREIANDGDKVVVTLLQPNKANSIVDEPILNYNAAKGSGAIAAAVTSMITMHRPGMSSVTPSDDVYLSMNIVKNRLGRLGQVDFGWEGRTGRITELEDIQKQDLAEFRAIKKANKEAKDDF